IFRGTVSQALDYFECPKGEFTLVIEGWREDEAGSGDELESRIKEMKNSGMKAKDAVSILAGETGLKRRDIYRAWLEE
ncbi:MAG: 16S rRNA (cytidine(1402)-2'-O)-methyltransferase, partial [Dehalococcoidales bacterium]